MAAREVHSPRHKFFPLCVAAVGDALELAVCG